MSQTATLRRLLTTPLPAAALYLGAMILLLFVIGNSLTDVLSQRADVAASAAMLEQLEGRAPTAASGQVFGIAGRSGSPFLEGATVTVAGAALLQHVTAAVTRFGGNVLSSQVDLQGTQSKSGFLAVIVSCDIDQPSLQQLLYDVESGMPFLFVPVRDRAAIRRIRVDRAQWERQLAPFWAPHIYVFTYDAELEGSSIHARMFAPALNIAEDPATGAAATALAGYLAPRDPTHDGTLRWVVEQGFEIGRPSILEVEADKQAGRITAIRVGGAAVLVSEGGMEIPMRDA